MPILYLAEDRPPDKKKLPKWARIVLKAVIALVLLTGGWAVISTILVALGLAASKA